MSEASGEGHGLSESTDDAGSATSLLSGKLVNVAAVASAAAAAYKLAADAVAEYAGKELAVAGLDASIASRGQLTEEYRETLQGLAADMQALTAVGDTDWYAVFEKLTQFGADSTNIEGYTKAVVNLAGFMGGDVPAAASLFGRAMEGNFSSLSRYGIKVDENATQTEKLDQLMTQLAQKGGGNLEARAKTLTGQFANMTNAGGDFSAAVGQIIADTGLLQSAMFLVTDAFQFWNGLIAQSIPKVEGLSNNIALQGLDAEEAAALNAGYAASLEETTEAAEETAAGVTKVTKAIEAQAKQAQAVARAERDRDLATVDADDTATAEEKAKRRAAIEAKYRGSILDADERATEESAAAREAAAREAADKAAAARKDANDAALAQQAAEEVAAAEQRAIAEIASKKKLIASLEEARVQTYPDPTFDNEEYERGMREVARVEAEIKRQKDLLAKGEAAEKNPEALQKAEAAALEAKAREDEAAALEAAATAARQSADEQNAASRQELQNQQEIAAIEKETSTIKSDKAVRDGRSADAAKQEATSRKESAAAAKEQAQSAIDEASAKERSLRAEEAAAFAAGSTGNPDRIDARSHRTKGLDGNIIEERGVAEHGRDRFGRPLDPNIRERAEQGGAEPVQGLKPPPERDKASGASGGPDASAIEAALAAARAEGVAAIARIGAAALANQQAIAQAAAASAASMEAKLESLRNLIASQRN